MQADLATPDANPFVLASLAAPEAGFGRLRHLERTGSTNTDLAEEARGGLTEPAVLVADLQTRGRGRLDRVWEASAGDHLLASFRLPATERTASDVVAAVAAAARSAADGLVPPPVAMKWPNDLVVAGGPHPGKLAGILAEFVPSDPATVVVGVGLNVGPIGFDGATSISLCGGDADRDALLAALIEGLPPRLGDRDGVTEELRRHSATLGTRVRVLLPEGRTLVGTALDLDADGHLLVDGGDTVHVVSVGDVVHLRSE